MKKKFNLTKKMISFLLCIIILFNIMPISVFGATFNGNEVEATLNEAFDYGLPTCDAKVVAYITPGAGELKTKYIDDDTIVIELDIEDGWSFAGWETCYNGPSTTDAENESWDSGDKYYFSVEDNIGIPYNNNIITKTATTIQINKEYDAGGAIGCTYSVYAICKPRIIYNADREIAYNTDGTDSILATYATNVTLGSSSSIIFKPLADADYVISGISVKGTTDYDPKEQEYLVSSNPMQYQLAFNNVRGPVWVQISTRLKQQKISFDANGGSGTMTTQTFNSGEEKALAANSFTKDKYSFIGWNTKADGSGTDYADKANISFIPTNDGDSITLYAQWERLPNATYTAPTANDLTYNNEEQELITEGTSNEGVLMYSLEENGTYKENIPTAEDAGKYTVWYYVEGDDKHNNSDEASVEVEIKKADPIIGEVSANIIKDTTDISSIVLERTDESVQGSLIIDKEQTLNLGDNEIKYSFIPDDSKNYNQIDGTVNVTVEDTIAPTGSVTFTDSETVWNDIPSTITFDMYFKNNQKVVVTATDSFSGIDKVEYYETNETLDLEGVKFITDDKWNLMEGDINLTAEDAKQFIYYIRITDKSGNIGYIATNGAEFDTTAPAITGVYDGKTYYTSQKVTVTDKNLDTVTLNGEIVTDTIILEGNKEAIYTIVATDKVGNSTTVTVKMAMLDEIADIDDVTPEDKPKLEDAKNELEKNLEENSDIYSEEEKKAIEDKIKDIEEALNVIENLKEEIIEDTEEEKIEDTDNLKNPTTEDNIGKYFTMFIVSILGISAIILIKNKRQK